MAPAPHLPSVARLPYKLEIPADYLSADEGIGEPGSFELSHDEVIALLQRLGFEILEQSQVPAGATGYVQDSRSMLQHVYRPAFWVAMKAEGNRRSPNLKSV